MTPAAAVWQQLQACVAPGAPATPSGTIILFAPRDNSAQALQTVLAAAATSIKIEMFAYTDAAIDEILHAKAALDGFEFQATFDESEAVGLASMAKLLAGWAGDPRVVTGRSEHGQIIHRKIAVVDHHYVIAGSTNWTYDGEHLEDNELVIRSSPLLAAAYEQVLDANHSRLTATTPAPAPTLA